MSVPCVPPPIPSFPPPAAVDVAHTAPLCSKATGLTPVVETNSHPFVFGRFTFAHNGTVAAFFEIKTTLLGLISPAARHNILGTTDTEHAAALFFTYLDPEGPWTKSYEMHELTAALEKTIATLHRLVVEVGRHGEKSSLNFLVTDGASFSFFFPLPPLLPCFSLTAASRGS